MTTTTLDLMQADAATLKARAAQVDLCTARLALATQALAKFDARRLGRTAGVASNSTRSELVAKVAALTADLAAAQAALLISPGYGIRFAEPT